MDASKKKLVVQAKEGDIRIFGETSSPFANEIGIIIRNVVSQHLTTWSQATPHGRELAYNCLLKEMVELQQSQVELEDEASIMDEAEICARVLGKSTGTISRIRPTLRKSYSNAVTAPPKLMQQLEILTKQDKEKDKTISELTQSLKQQALLIQSLVARMDMSQHPSTKPTNDPPPSPPPPPSVGATVLLLYY
ncbi:Hypothetical predicted protein [Olea europaea subsp. europaea]|uniref:Uncharacterized protein n=1 Tax=Olea europaea subsp. europaea TaxID=158383 RepID=A0A8S0UHL9_OLEEU|nr:Hypothetical predicted protein [Olea europaea subsp. europaea]